MSSIEEPEPSSSQFKRGQSITATILQFGPLGASVEVDDGAGTYYDSTPYKIYHIRYTVYMEYGIWDMGYSNPQTRHNLTQHCYNFTRILQVSV